MALANFFDKAALSAAAFLRGTSVEAIRDRLQLHVVGVAFDDAAACTAEGRHTLELLTDLLARLYPRLALVPIYPGAPAANDGRLRIMALARSLHERANAINPRIEVSSSAEGVGVLVVVGESNLTSDLESAAFDPGDRQSGADEDRHAACVSRMIYAGSSGWIARLSGAMPVGSGRSDNPIGAGAAACLAAAVVFRTIFAPELGTGKTRTATAAGNGVEGAAQNRARTWTEFSLLDLTLVTRSGDVGARGTHGADTKPSSIDIGETFLIGAGAIGEAAVWAIARVRELTGTLHVVDGEKVELSNLQRYTLTTQESVGEQKVAIAAQTFESERTRRAGTENGHGQTHAMTQHEELDVITHATTWAAYIDARGDYGIDRVLLALDSAEDRMAVQASLPRWIANAWTQPDNLGVSRHDFLGERPCVCCLYIPSDPRKSKDVLYAEAFGCRTQPELMEIRTLLYNRRPIGRDFVLRAAARMGVPADDLLPFAQQSLDEFYVSAICGGIVLRLGGQLSPGQAAEVPMAFQSALAGILLAAELVADAAGLRNRVLPARTELDLVHLDLLAPQALRLNSPMTKHPSGRCICQDPVFRDRYREKHGIGHAESAVE